MIQQKLVDEISLHFPVLFFMGKYVKIRFGNRGSPCYFLSSRAQIIKKLLQNLNKRDCFCLHSGFHFYGVSHAKTDLLNKYMICLSRLLNEITY